MTIYIPAIFGTYFFRELYLNGSGLLSYISGYMIGSALLGSYIYFLLLKGQVRDREQILKLTMYVALLITSLKLIPLGIKSFDSILGFSIEYPADQVNNLLVSFMYLAPFGVLMENYVRTSKMKSGQLEEDSNSQEVPSKRLIPRVIEKWIMSRGEDHVVSSNLVRLMNNLSILFTSLTILLTMSVSTKMAEWIFSTELGQTLIPFYIIFEIGLASATAALYRGINTKTA